MSARVGSPATIGSLPRRQGLAFLSLFFVPALSQAILLTVVPLEALRLLGDARAVTLVYVGAGLVAVAGRFSIPLLVRLIRRQFVFTLGAVAMAVSCALLASDQLPGLAVGIALSTFAFACIEITSQLYLLDRVSRQALRHFEPMRIFAIAAPWTLGPWFGVYLQETYRSLRRSSWRAPPPRRFWCCSGRCAQGRTCCWQRRGGRPRRWRGSCADSSPNLGCGWPGGWRRRGRPGGACSTFMRRSTR